MQASHGEYRRHPRTDVHISVAVDLAGNQLQTSTLNVSERGIGIATPKGFQFETGQLVNVQLNQPDNLNLTATVVRISTDQLGLKLKKNRLTDQDIDRIVDSAPFLERTRIHLRRQLRIQFRRLGVLTANTLLRPLLLAWIRPQFIFAVYGTRKDVSTYYTPLMEKMLPPMIIGGLIRKGDAHGLLVASQHLESELSEDSNKVRNYIDRLQKDFAGVETIALVGRLPNFTLKSGIPIEPPLVDGSMGTRYMIWDATRQILKMEEYRREVSIVVLGGAGRIGNRVCEDLLRLFPRVLAFDARYTMETQEVTDRGIILKTASLRRLGEHRLFIALTHHGDVIQEMAPYIPRGALIADDTHPCISLAVREQLAGSGIKTLKIVLAHEAFTIWPRMPAWNNQDIPGCLVEAMVLLNAGRSITHDFDAFRDVAENAGFRGRIIEPPEE